MAGMHVLAGPLLKPWGALKAMLFQLSGGGVGGAGWEAGWRAVPWTLAFCSRLLQVREAAKEERKPRVSGSEGTTCKVSAAQNAFIMSQLRACPA